MSAMTGDLVREGQANLPEAGMAKGWESFALILILVALFGFGLVNLYSASAFLAERQGQPDHYYVTRQALGGGIGFVFLLVAAWVPYGWWRWAAWPLLFAVFGALVLTVLPWTEGIAPEINGARRWVRLGVTLQPSEFAKLAILVWTAHMAVRKRPDFDLFWRGLGPFMVMGGILLIPVLIQPDLSTAVVIALLAGVVVFSAGARIRHFVLIALAASPVAWFMLTRGFRADRLRAYGDLDGTSSGAGYQVHQSLIALGSGGATGVGFGEGRQKFGFLPEPHNDFIFSMIGEEWGFVGVFLIMALYLAIVVVGFRIARKATDLFGQLMAVGITSFIALHAVLHMAVGLGVIPATGLPLPLVSYGRSNLLVTLVSMGILISISRGDADRRLRRGPSPSEVIRV
jgi:cell division protein FtsW